MPEVHRPRAGTRGVALERRGDACNSPRVERGWAVSGWSPANLLRQTLAMVITNPSNGNLNRT
eukprot:6013033-Pyramimonas_sp.AAC.1